MANEMKEKALQVKQDMDQLFDAGKQDVIDNSKYIEKSASGSVIRLDDVSEVAHKVKVKADTPTEVKVYGKNLFNIDDDTRFKYCDMDAYNKLAEYLKNK